MSVFIQRPPPPPPQNTDPSNPSAQADMSNNQSLIIRAIEDTQNVVDGIYTYLDNYPPVLLTDATTGRQYNVLAQPQGIVDVVNQTTGPFGVTISGNPTVGFTALVNELGSLLQSLILDDTVAITGLNSSFAFDLGNDLIWLEITLDGSGNIVSATIASYGLGGAWVPSDPPQEYGTGSGPFECGTTYDAGSNPIFTQYIARIAIFSSVTSSVSPFPIINTQLLTSNLIMEGDIYSGDNDFSAGITPAVVGIVMPKLFAGPYISP